jgi:hypothetical protein
MASGVASGPGTDKHYDSDNHNDSDEAVTRGLGRVRRVGCPGGAVRGRRQQQQQRRRRRRRRQRRQRRTGGSWRRLGCGGDGSRWGRPVYSSGPVSLPPSEASLFLSLSNPYIPPTALLRTSLPLSRPYHYLPSLFLPSICATPWILPFPLPSHRPSLRPDPPACNTAAWSFTV